MSNFDSFTQNEILKAIDFFQDEFYGHPLTCGNDSNHQILRGRKKDDGMVELYCKDCDYTQEYIPDYVIAVWDSREEIMIYYQQEPMKRFYDNYMEHRRK